MAGIFPQGGVSAPNTINGDPNLDTVPGCPPLFHPARCIPRFDAASANAVISELVNAINGMGRDYDCNRLDNLQLALAEVRKVCTYQKTNITLPNLANDFVLGCWGENSGLIPVQQILDQVKIPTICSLPAKAPDLNDFLAGCFDDADGIATVQSIVDLVLAQIVTPPSSLPGLYRIGGMISTDEDSNRQSAPFDGRNIDGIYVKNSSNTGTSARFGDVGNTTDIAGGGAASHGVFDIFRVPVTETAQYEDRKETVILKTAPLTWYRFNAFGIRGQKFSVTDDSQLIVKIGFSELNGVTPAQFYPMYKL